MLRNTIAMLTLAVGTFVPTFTILAPDAAEAKHRRVTAVTSCHPDSPTFDDFDSGGVDTWYVTSSTTVRSGNGLRMNLHSGWSEGVRCEVPTDSWMPHQTVTEVHVSGNKSAANGFASNVKACSTWFGNGSYSCSASKALPSGNFNVVLNVGNVWNDPSALPMVTAVLADDDRLYGVYYTDA